MKNYPESIVRFIFESKLINSKIIKKKYLNKKILDIGFGNKRHSEYFKELGFDCYGTEINKKTLKRNTKKFKLLKSDNLIYPDKVKFDYIFAFNSIYYVLNDKINFDQKLKKIKLHLKKSSRFVFTLPGKKHSYLKNKNKNFLNHREKFLRKLFIIDLRKAEQIIKNNFKILLKIEILEKSKLFIRHLNLYICIQK